MLVVVFFSLLSTVYNHRYFKIKEHPLFTWKIYFKCRHTIALMLKVHPVEMLLLSSYNSFSLRAKHQATINNRQKIILNWIAWLCRIYKTQGFMAVDCFIRSGEWLQFRVHSGIESRPLSLGLKKLETLGYLFKLSEPQQIEIEIENWDFILN